MSENFHACRSNESSCLISIREIIKTLKKYVKIIAFFDRLQDQRVRSFYDAMSKSTGEIGVREKRDKCKYRRSTSLKINKSVTCLV